MGRLIDADAFKERIGTETKMRRMMCMAIDEQPTAYDVEKVVEQIKYKLFCRDLPTNIVDHIVRKGGVE